jgi:glycine/D-amino acid oxidase-like deaminating enzyme
MARKSILQKSNGHAVIIGASITSLVTARVLSDYFEKVTIIERDQLPEAVEARKGVPQGHHLHFLLTQGQFILREFFPLLFDDLTDDGAIPIPHTDIRWYQFGSWQLRIPTGTQIHSQSRDLHPSG